MSDEAAPYVVNLRARRVFFASSAFAGVVVLVLGHAVLLPFLLAVLVAYVLFPIVRRVERRRVPRWAAILLVYILGVGAIGAFAWSALPTLFGEVKSLAGDLPTITQRVRNDWLPRVDARLRTLSPSEPSTPIVGEGSPPSASLPPLLVTPRPDGGFEIRLQDELQFKPTHDGSWVLAPREEAPRPFSSERALRDAFDRSLSHIQAHSAELVQVGRQIIGGISRGIFFFFITLMLAAYLMITWERLRQFFDEMLTDPHQRSFDRFLRRVDRGLAGVVRGQLLICLVNGVLTAVGLWIFHVKYWPVLSLIAAAMSIIPIFGSILSSVPAVAIGLAQGPGTAFGVLLWIIGIHQLEANFLNPKIIGDQAKIHPVLVVFALLVGESLFAITGALLAVPCLAVVQAVFMHFRESVLGLHDAGLPPDEPTSRRGGAADVPLGSASEPVV